MDLDGLLAPTRALGAQWSIAVRRDDSTAAFVAHEPSVLLRTASVAKVFLLVELAGRLARDKVDPLSALDRRGTPPIHDSGLWHVMHAERLPVSDLGLLVGAVSDNWATNALLELCGLERVRAVAAQLAPGGSTLLDRVRDKRSAEVPETLSLGCAADWAAIMQRLRYADGLDDAVCERVLGWLAHDVDLSMVAAAFDLDPLAHDTDDLGLRLWHKTGTDAGVRADVGVVQSGKAVASYAVICNWPPDDTSAGTRRAVLSTMRRIGDEIRAAI